jgi:hypothetical protein
MSSFKVEMEIEERMAQISEKLNTLDRDFEEISRQWHEEVDQVMAERLGHDEDYGFDYGVDWKGDSA